MSRALGAIVLAIITGLGVAGCAEQPAPTATLVAATVRPVAQTPVTQTPAATPATAPNRSVTPQSSLPPIDTEIVRAGWTVASEVDASGPNTRISILETLRADAYVDVLYACARPGLITIALVDAGADPPETSDRSVATIETECSSTIGAFTTPGPSRDTAVSLEVSTSAPGVRYWVLLTVPEDDIVPR